MLTQKLPIGSGVCRCAGCGGYFRSLRAFEMHRTGDYRPLTRRCLSCYEMRDAGMVQRSDGFWTTGKPFGSSLRLDSPDCDREQAALTHAVGA